MKRIVLAIAVSLFAIGAANACPKHILSRAAVNSVKFAAKSGAKVGKAVVKGSKANVPTSCKITMDAKTIPFKGNARMIKKGGTWKWDLTFTDDAEKATSTALMELIGKPTTSKTSSLSQAAR